MLRLYREDSNLNASEYRKYHESFMQNNHGSTAFHTFMCIFFTVQCTIFCSLRTQQGSTIVQYIIEYCVIVLPLICAHTVFAEYIYLLNILIFILVVCKFLHYYPNLHINAVSKLNTFPQQRAISISSIRSLTYLITVLCILAVDFNDFPRHLAKTEKYGYSLMDTGVGLFVIMSGLVHKNVRDEKFTNVFKGNLKFIVILLVLGIARFISVKQLDYQEHVTEYGVHWNFFFTLAVCKFLSSILLYNIDQPLILGTFILFLHELSLYIGLEEWVFSNAPRNTFLAANREGICSCLGYVSLYMLAAYAKQELMKKTQYGYKIINKFMFGSIQFWVLFFFLDTVRPTSRTLANASYCIYLNAMLFTVLPIMYFCEIFFNIKENMYFKVPKILSAINKNGLVYFVSANLLTGLINMTLKTLLVKSHYSFVILNIYMITTIAIVVHLNSKGYRI